MCIQILFNTNTDLDNYWIQIQIFLEAQMHMIFISKLSRLHIGIIIQIKMILKFGYPLKCSLYVIYAHVYYNLLVHNNIMINSD
jgi:hypothetical protein